MKSEQIYKEIAAVVDKRQYEVSLVNFGKAIEIIGKGRACGSRFWIRLENYLGKTVFNINSVDIVPTMQKRGTLLKVYNAALISEEIDSVEVTSVCSNEMHEWCKKRNMVYDEMNNKYYQIRRVK